MKMPEAWLHHLPLGFSTLHKPDPLHYCDANCSNFSVNTEPIKILACGHTYHTSCYNNNGLKCLHCLLFLQNGIDEHVGSLLERLQRFNEQQVQVEEPENDIPCDDNDETEPVDYAIFSLEQSLQKFRLQWNLYLGRCNFAFLPISFVYLLFIFIFIMYFYLVLW